MPWQQHEAKIAQLIAWPVDTRGHGHDRIHDEEYRNQMHI